ncbi:coat protein [water chestnut virus A]|uniref:Coat protein n=1 Tax=water chestnut virus A TaxID=2884706 RepID=A0A8K1NCT9_9BROM|nr:coat protein [water chestnut virus A]
MTFCSTCGKRMPCGMNHNKSKGKSKPTSRSQNWAQHRKSGVGNSNTSGSRQLPKILPSRTDWVMHGPNVKPKRFNGVVSTSMGTAVTAPKKGSYYSISIKDCLRILGNTDTTIFGIIIRFCSDHASGVFGLVKDFTPTDPIPPNPLSRRKFVKGEATGIQLLAPINLKVNDVNSNTFLVLKFNTDFEAGAILWMRDMYLQHSAPPKVDIPESVLYTDSLPTEEVD